MRSFLSLLSIFMVSVMLTFMVGCFYNYFYPMKFQAEIIKAGEDNNISPALIASVINVESRFDENAVSSKGAVGLMQIMPDTAKWLCESLGLDYENIDLKNGKTNIKIGSRYLSILLNSFSDVKSAICAYNAGPNKVKGWIQQQSKDSSGKETLNSIPYKETSEYLNKVQKNIYFYSKKYKNN